MSVPSLKKEQQLEKENEKKIQFTNGKQSFLWLEISGALPNKDGRYISKSIQLNKMR